MRWIKIVERILATVPVMLGVALIVFLFMHLTPGDPVDLLMGNDGNVSEAEMAVLREEFNLDLPLSEQLALFFRDVARGDLGQSIVNRRPVAELIRQRLPATIELAAAAFCIAVLIAVPVGVISAVNKYSWLDRLSMAGAYLGISMPAFWFGIILMLVFGVSLHLLPVAGRLPYHVRIAPITNLHIIDSLLTGNWVGLGTAVRHLILPAFTMALAMIATVARVTRSSMLEVMGQDYINLARAKGLSEFAVVVWHGLRNALIPVVTVVSLQMGAFLGGNMIVETIFGWPGIGRLVVDAIFSRDYPLVQGAVMVYAFTYVLFNLLADIMYTLVNPRIDL
ncbi:MAG: ABC transporter permease [bacterium]|jgi:ABC-type dipeptide/oligopeptide/nickel transport system permease component